jgi:hypothetical protein
MTKRTKKRGAKVTKDLAKQFFNRFAGLPRAYGTYTISSQQGGNKVEGTAQTMRKAPTIEHWHDHLAGKQGIGIVPIRDDGSVRFGAIDVDVYDLDLVKLEAQVAEAQLPLITCKTKSGGAHLYLFCKEDISAELVRSKLMNWAVALGYSGVEVFPKQIRLSSERDVGNWINMPYFGTDRWALMEGDWLHPEDFLLLAEERAVDAATLKSIEPPANEADSLLEDAPPCLQCLARTGVGQGYRNQGLFNIGVYLRKRFGDDEYAEKLDAYNQQFMDPPLGHKEVAQTARGVGKKAYEYRCHEEPIVSVCNRQICLTRKYGIGTTEGDPGVTFGPLIKIKTDPPIWIWSVDGARIELTTQELRDQNRFHARVMEELNKWPYLMKPKAWSELIRQHLEQVEEHEAPPDAKMDGVVMSMLMQYCSTRAMARSKEELLNQKPWQDGDKTYFSGPDFHRYLAQQRVSITDRKLWVILRNNGAGHQVFWIKGRKLNCWSVPALQLQTEPFDAAVDTEQETM